MVLTVDIGTSVFKTAIWDFNGNRIAFAASKLVINSSDSLYYEADSNQWIEAFEDCCGVLSGTIKLSTIDAVVICGNGPSLTPTIGEPNFSKSGLSIQAAPVRLWLDKRAACRQVSAIIGGYVDPCFLLPKALDIKINEPLFYDKTKYFLGCPEFLAYALTGEARTVFPSDGFDRWFWTEKTLEQLGLEKEKFPPFIRPGENFGGLSVQAASYFGLNPGIPVICGGPDFFAAILGCGVIKPGQACDRCGTSEGINACTETRILNDRFMSYGHPIKPYWNLSGIISTAGKAVEWACNILGIKSYNLFFKAAETSPAGAGGLVFLPYLAGERLFADNTAQPLQIGGTFSGLNLSTGQGELARSVLEGINFAILDIIFEMEKAGAGINELCVAGGIFTNKLLNQIKADILQRPVIVPQQKEAELMGLALIGSCYCGKYSSFEEAASTLVKTDKTFLPCRQKTDLYNNLFLRYHKLKENLLFRG